MEAKGTARNSSIDIFRYICAIMVVSIHVKPFYQLSDRLSFWVSDVWARLAVPFFFAVAGYYYISKLEQDRAPLLPYLKRLLPTYVKWSLVYYLVQILVGGEFLDFKDFVGKALFRFVFTGSYYHFWFFPGLIFSVCLTTLLFRIGWKKALIPLSIILYGVGCLGSPYRAIGTRIPILGSMFMWKDYELVARVLFIGFPYFVCGYVVRQIERRCAGVSIKRIYKMTIAAVVIWLSEIFVLRKLGWRPDAVISLGQYLVIVVILLVLLRNPLPKYRSLANGCRSLANFTFYAHCLFAILIYELRNQVPQFQPTAMEAFCMVVGLTFVLGLLFHRANRKHLNWLIN